MQSENSKYPILDNIDVPDDIIQVWQETLNILARFTDIPAALIMRVHSKEIEVFLSSKSEGNVYSKGEIASLDSGLYCETVMDTRKKLLVPNAKKDPVWDHNPDIKLGMISYCGMPLIWPNGEIFGTICILDKKENEYTQQQSELLEMFRDLVQISLKAIYSCHQLALDKAAMEELNKKLEIFNTIMVEREMRIIEMKKEINAMCKAMEQEPKYKEIEAYKPEI